MSIKYFDIENPSMKLDFADLMRRNYRENASPYSIVPSIDLYDINNTAVIFENCKEDGIVTMVGQDESIIDTVHQLEGKLKVKLEERK